MKLFMKMFAFCLCLALIFPALAAFGGEESDEVEQAPQVTEAEPKLDTEAAAETPTEATPAPVAPVEQAAPAEAPTASTKNETSAVADSGRTAEVRIGSDAQAPVKPAPTIAPPKPVRAPAATARLVVEGERPVVVEFQLFVDPVKTKSNAFNKEVEEPSYAKYTLEIREDGHTDSFVLNERGPVFSNPTLNAENYSQGGRNLYRIDFQMPAPAGEYGKAVYREDHFFLWCDSAGELIHNVGIPAWTEERFELSADTAFEVERTFDGSLDWNSNAYLVINDKVTWTRGEKKIVEFRSERWFWNNCFKCFQDPRRSLEYEVQKGDMLVSIGRFYFDSSTAWQKILDANPDINPKNMKIGSRLKIPIE